MTWGLGTFADDGRGAFPGLVLDERRVIDVSGFGWPSVRAVLAGGDAAFRVLQGLAADGDDGIALEGLRVLPPVGPVHILQSGANYRRHVMDIVVAEERERGPTNDEEARELGARIMDERAASGEPYIFLGATSAMVGAYDDVILPARGDQHDWELEPVAVIGAGGRDIDRADALHHVAGYTIANDLTTRDLVYRPDLKAIGTDWLRAKNAPTFLPVGPWIVPAALRRRSDGPDHHAARRRPDDAGRVHQRHDLRRGHTRRLRLDPGGAAAGRPRPDRLAGRQRDASPALPAARRPDRGPDHRAGAAAQPLRGRVGVSVALVTGGGRGLGEAIARRLAQAGHTVAIADRAGAAQVAATIEGAEAHAVDLADAGAVDALAATLLQRHGRVDVLVNNAAHLGRHELADLDLDVLRRFTTGNVEAPLLLTRALVPAMVAGGHGRIVNVVPNTIWSPPGPGMVPDVTSKGALLGMTRALAVELGAGGVTVNAVAPGLTPTPASVADMAPELFDAVIDRQAIKRRLEPRDIAAAVAYLASDEAGAVTGHALRVDGGNGDPVMTPPRRER